MIASHSYPLARSSGVCAASGAAFAPGEPIVAALVERPGSPHLERLDFSREAWARGARPPLPARLFASWKSSHLPPEPKKNSVLSDAELTDLFEELARAGDAVDSRRAGFRYLLAVLLVRRRVLRLEGQKGANLLVRPRQPAGASEPAPLLEIPDPGLDESAVNEAIEQFGQIVSLEAP